MINQKTTRIAAALGQTEAQLVFKNASVFDVWGGDFHICDVAVLDGVIVGLGKYTGEVEIDLDGQYLLPGFIDSHMHIESSYLSPARYAQAVMPFGVTSVIADPHEIANVCGEEGLKFMFESARDVPLDIHFMMPSCVNATPFDHSGARFSGRDTMQLMEKYDFLGLGEMMDYTGVLTGNTDVMEKLSSANKIDGHAPGLTQKELCGYVASGIDTDHEALSAAEALEKIRLGMYILLREGTLAKDTATLAPALNPHNAARFALCTDDKHIDDILENGTIGHCIQVAVAAGIPAEYALKAATFNAAQCYGLDDVGAIAPGYRADLIISRDNIGSDIVSVYKDGIKVAEHNQPLFDVAATPITAVSNTVHIAPLAPGQLTTGFDSSIPVIQTTPQSLATKKVYAENADGLCHLAVIERHHATGNIGKAFVSGLSIRHGAVAQTIGHDSHNITVLGDTDANMRIAVEALGQEGGIAVVADEQVIARLALPIGGLMSDQPIAEVVNDYELVIAALTKISPNPSGELLMCLAFLSLLVIPEIRLSDQGLFDVGEFSFI